MLADALRSFRAAPGVTTFILLILILTISAATVTFSVVDTVVLRPLPFDDCSATAIRSDEMFCMQASRPPLLVSLPTSESEDLNRR